MPTSHSILEVDHFVHDEDADPHQDQPDADEEIARRKAEWIKPEPRYTSGVLAKYAQLVSTSSKGAVTDLNLAL